MKYVAITFFLLAAIPVLLIATVGAFSSQSDTRHAGRVLNEFPAYRNNVGQEPFTAIADCPKCGTLALHHIKDTLTYSCRRECVECNYVWRQI